MSKPEERPALDDVLDTYLAAVEEPDLDSARDWGRRFPEHADAIRDFVMSWKLAATLPPDPRAAPSDEEAFLQRGMAVVAGVLLREQEKDLAASALPPIENLLTEAKARGMTPPELAAKLSLSVPLVAKLSRRLIEPASIPRQLVEAIAGLLGRASDAIASYFELQSTIAAGAFHRASKKPTVAHREDFFAAVQSDPAITKEHRARWLSSAPDGKPRP